MNNQPNHGPPPTLASICNIPPLPDHPTDAVMRGYLLGLTARTEAAFNYCISPERPAGYMRAYSGPLFRVCVFLLTVCGMEEWELETGRALRFTHVELFNVQRRLMEMAGLLRNMEP